LMQRRRGEDAGVSKGYRLSSKGWGEQRKGRFEQCEGDWSGGVRPVRVCPDGQDGEKISLIHMPSAWRHGTGSSAA